MENDLSSSVLRDTAYWIRMKSVRKEKEYGKVFPSDLLNDLNMVALHALSIYLGCGIKNRAIHMITTFFRIVAVALLLNIIQSNLSNDLNKVALYKDLSFVINSCVT